MSKESQKIIFVKGFFTRTELWRIIIWRLYATPLGQPWRYFPQSNHNQEFQQYMIYFDRLKLVEIIWTLWTYIILLLTVHFLQLLTFWQRSPFDSTKGAWHALLPDYLWPSLDFEPESPNLLLPTGWSWTETNFRRFLKGTQAAQGCARMRKDAQGCTRDIFLDARG